MEGKSILPEEVAEKYSAVSNNCRFITAAVEVDLTKLTLAEADKLYDSGFPFLILKKPGKVKPAEKG